MAQGGRGSSVMIPYSFQVCYDPHCDARGDGQFPGEAVECVLIDWIDGTLTDEQAARALGQLGQSSEHWRASIEEMRRARNTLLAMGAGLPFLVGIADSVLGLGQGLGQGKDAIAGHEMKMPAVARGDWTLTGEPATDPAGHGARGPSESSGNLHRSMQPGVEGSRAGSSRVSGGMWRAAPAWAAMIVAAALAATLSYVSTSRSRSAAGVAAGGYAAAPALQNNRLSAKAKDTSPGLPRASDARVAMAPGAEIGLSSRAVTGDLAAGSTDTAAVEVFAADDSQVFSATSMGLGGDERSAAALASTQSVGAGFDLMTTRLVLDSDRAEALAREGRLLVRVVSDQAIPLIEPLAPLDSRWHVDDEVTRAMLEAVRPYFAANSGVVPPTQMGPNEGRFLTTEMYGPPPTGVDARAVVWSDGGSRAEPTTFIVHVRAGSGSLERLKSALISQHRAGVLFEEVPGSFPRSGGADDDVSVPVIVDLQ